MTNNVVGLVNRNLGHPPPFRKSFQDCDHCIANSVFYVN